MGKLVRSDEKSKHPACNNIKTEFDEIPQIVTFDFGNSYFDTREWFVPEGLRKYSN